MRRGSMLPFLGVAAYVLYKGLTDKSSEKEVILKGTGETKMNLKTATGKTENGLKFLEDAEFRLTLKTELTHGYVTAEFLDSDKNPIICLNCFEPTGVLKVEKDKPYYQIIRFDSATGSYEIVWERLDAAQKENTNEAIQDN